MRPLDPELIRRSGAVRGAIARTLLTGVIAAAASAVQAGAAAAVIAQAFLQHKPLATLSHYLVAFACAWGVRAIAQSLQDAWARTAGLRAVLQLRQDVARAYARTEGQSDNTLALMSRGIDALEIYIARYLPQLVLAVVLPIGLGAWILRNDWWTAVVLVITIPLIPLFMALIGWFTDTAVTRQWQVVGRITDVIDDLFAGLPDLVVFNRAKAQASLIRRLGSDATSATMKVLRISFLSSFALELIATISVAIVALGIGLRLTNGEMDLETGLMILILVPDVYLPIRLVGTQFHAAVEGMEAWTQALPLLQEPETRTVALEEVITSLHLHDVESGYTHPVHRPVTVHLERGAMLAITGPSGVGKTTLLRSIAGLITPLAGQITVNQRDVHSLEESAWFARVGYVPQDPWLGHGTVRDALTKGVTASDADCRAALAELGLSDIALDAVVDDFGSGVSVGQRRRIALARYALRRCDVMLLDEPTAAVDADSEAAILHRIMQWRTEGRILIVVAHRPALVAAASDVLHLVGVR